MNSDEKKGRKDESRQKKKYKGRLQVKKETKDKRFLE